MAIHKSALKRHRQSLKNRDRNRVMKTRIKNAIKAVRQAIEANDSETTAQALKAATSILDKAASKKVIHRCTAARKISRLSLAVNKI